jgi:glycerol transport system ATP-binding protein
MASIALDGVSHAYADAKAGTSHQALNSICHEWEDGGAYALLGPSGCGKTTLLNIISGLLSPSRGRVYFDRRDVTALPAAQRNIAQVFQFPVIYDNMTVAENLMFPLRNRKMARAERETRVKEVLSMLELDAMANRKARRLGADIQQKISLGRGLVRTDANAILFDEPLTVIDPDLKWQLRAQLKKVHQQFGHTMIYVTHDQTEALTFADRVVVMLEGEVVQIGTPEELFNAPAHTFVGQFIGSPGMNILPCELEGGYARIGAHRVALDRDIPSAKGRLELGIRPEHIELVEQLPDSGALPVGIGGIEDLGRYRIVQLRLDQHRLQALVPEGIRLPASPAMRLPPAQLKVYRDSVLLEGAGQ